MISFQPIPVIKRSEYLLRMLLHVHAILSGLNLHEYLNLLIIARVPVAVTSNGELRAERHRRFASFQPGHRSTDNNREYRVLCGSQDEPNHFGFHSSTEELKRCHRNIQQMAYRSHTHISSTAYTPLLPCLQAQYHS